MKKILAFFLFFLFAASLMKVFYFFTDGFRLNKLIYFTNDDIYVEEKPLDERIINQKFYYLGKGRQSYVFVSGDKKYVLKLIRYHKYQRPLWADFLFSLHLINSKQKIMLEEQKIRKQRAFVSYLFAKKELQPLTHVNYLHLKRTKNIKKSLFLYDLMGIKHTVCLDNVFFIIQEKACSLHEKMTSLYEEKKEQKLKEIISSFFDMLLFRIQKNIANRDHMNYLRNSGVIDNKVMEVDVGSFYYEDLQTFLAKKKELKRCLVTLEKFVEDKMPSLRLFIEEKKKKAFLKFK